MAPELQAHGLIFKHWGACYARINTDVGVHSLCTGYVYVMAALT